MIRFAPKLSALFMALVAAFCSVAQATAAETPATVPDCFTPPRLPIAAAPISIASTPQCAELSKVVASTEPKDVAWIPGEGLNAILGLTEGGFPSNAYAIHFRVTKAFNDAFAGQDELVRFGEDEGRARGGSWWTTLQFVSDGSGKLMNADRVEAVLALPLPSVLHVVAYSNGVAVGTLGYFGLVAPAFGRPGGAVQFWFPSEPVFTMKTAPLQ
jgi:hypothetical protein